MASIVREADRALFIVAVVSRMSHIGDTEERIRIFTDLFQE